MLPAAAKAGAQLPVHHDTPHTDFPVPLDAWVGASALTPHVEGSLLLDLLASTAGMEAPLVLMPALIGEYIGH